MYSVLVINLSAINREIAWIGLLQCSLNNEIPQGVGDQYFGLLGIQKVWSASSCGAPHLGQAGGYNVLMSYILAAGQQQPHITVSSAALKPGSYHNLTIPTT